MNWPLPEKYILMANKQMKIYSTWYVVKEMQIKMMNYHYPSIKMAKPQIMTTPKADKDVQQQELLLPVGMQNGIATLEDSVAVSFLQN